MSLLATLLAALGFAFVALAMRRHAALLAAPRPRVMRVGGGILLALSLALCLMAWPAKIAWVAWFGLLTIGALAAVLLVTWRSARKTKRPRR